MTASHGLETRSRPPPLGGRRPDGWRDDNEPGADLVSPGAAEIQWNCSSSSIPSAPSTPGAAALDHVGHVVEVTRAHFLLVRHKGVALVACGKFGLLHHFHVVLHAFAACVVVRELEAVVPVDMDASQGDELELVAQRRQLFLEGCDLLVVEVFLPVERRRAVVRQQLARAGRQHGLGEFAGKADVGHAGFAPHQVGIRRIGHAAADGLFQAVFDALETFLRALAGQERLVVGVRGRW
ncbi:hypothetical protein FQA39_LY19089 [Lamprigera yunnana]|nr:hypothetical protein FQA39_LY19089 [Lamprigera yunnana]